MFEKICMKIYKKNNNNNIKSFNNRNNLNNIVLESRFEWC